MSSRLYIVHISDPSVLSFEEFYNDFLNKDGNYEDVHITDIWDKNKLIKETKAIYEQILDDITYASSDYFYDRDITSSMASYIATVGIPIKVNDISGGSPMITVLRGEMNHKYVKDPYADLEKRFSYMLRWVKECGLEPGEKKL
jgi:hypothetical protein